MLDTGRSFRCPGSLRGFGTSSHLVAARAARGQATERDLRGASLFAALAETGPCKLENGRSGQGVKLAGP